MADPVVTAAADFFTKDAPQPEEPAPAPVFDTSIVQPTAPVVQPQMPQPPEAAPIQPAVPRVSAENAVAFRSAPDEDGWISITAEPVEEKDINSLVAAAMEKPAVSEQAAATAPTEEPSRWTATNTSTRPSSCLKNRRRKATPAHRRS